VPPLQPAATNWGLILFHPHLAFKTEHARGVCNARSTVQEGRGVCKAASVTQVAAWWWGTRPFPLCSKEMPDCCQKGKVSVLRGNASEKPAACCLTKRLCRALSIARVSGQGHALRPLVCTDAGLCQSNKQEEAAACWAFVPSVVFHARRARRAHPAVIPTRGIWGQRAKAKLRYANLFEGWYFHSNHRIIEWFGLEGTLKIIWFQPPCYEQGHLPPAQVAQSSIQPGLEPCQGGGSHSFSGQTGPVFHHPHGKEFLPNISS